MKTEIINNGTTEFPFYTVMVDGEEYCSTSDIKKAENIVNLLSIHIVSGSLPTKKYEIDFGTHLRCGIDVTNNELNVLGAMDGWGNGVSKDVIVIKKL